MLKMGKKNFLGIVCLLIFAIFAFSACAKIKTAFSTVEKPSPEECLRRVIAKQIDSNPRLSEIPVLVESVSGGNVKLRIAANNERPVSDETILAIRRGESLQRIRRNDGSIRFLIEFENRLKKLSAVKNISWSADEPCAPGFVCQTTGSSEKSADEEEIDALCAEYQM